MIVLLEAKRQTKRLVSAQSGDEMIGLYYQLTSGVDLFICKAWPSQTRMLTHVIKNLVKRPPDLVRILDVNAFHRVCGEAFTSSRLYTKVVPANAVMYPLYSNTGIIRDNSNTAS